MPKLSFQMRRNQVFGLAVFGVLVMLFQIGFSLYKKYQPQEPIKIELISETLPSLTLTDFDPNELDENQWLQLGFSEKQVQTILKYKQAVGGGFISKEQLAKCYAITPEKFSELEKYILLPDKADASQVKGYPQKYFTKREISINQKFNPDDFLQEDWQRIGFSENQAKAILKYKHYLGGSFQSKEKLKACFIINDENYRKLEPYLLLPEKNKPEDKTFATHKSAKILYSVFDPNTLDLAGWQQLGFSEKQAQVILNYKNRNLKGNFKSVEDVKNCFVISTEKFEEIKPFIRLKISENTEVKAIIKTDFTQLDINSISFQQLLEFGFNEKAASSFVGFRKVLGGFAHTSQVLETYHIDRDLAEKLIQTLEFNTNNVQKYSLPNAPESFLKSHPYFKYFAERIIFLRVSYPNEKEILKQLKLKPEQEAKMRWYLK